MAIPGFTLAKRLHAGETVYSGWCGLPYPLVAETIAREGGFSAVTIEGQSLLAEWSRDRGGTLTRISVERAGALGSFTAWRPALPVVQWAVTKP